ncbi:MAG: alpha/beta fold hydrolase [Gaiellaceae bacterium]
MTWAPEQTGSGWLETDGVRLHYLSRGSGEPVVMLHGNPTSSYLYRHFVDPLAAAGYRAIAHDQLGFGRSDKPADEGAYTVSRHVRHFGALVDELGLADVTLVVHDWGGPVGLGWAVEHPELVKRLVLLNTVAWPAPRRRPMLGYRILASRGLGDFLVRRAHAVVRYAQLRRLVARPLPETDRRAYLAAHPTPASRTGILAYIRLADEAVRGGPARDALERVGARLELLRDKPTLIVWGLRDPILKPSLLKAWRRRFPDAEVHELADASHFLQDDAHERIVPLLVDFLRRT